MGNKTMPAHGNAAIWQNCNITNELNSSSAGDAGRLTPVQGIAILKPVSVIWLADMEGGQWTLDNRLLLINTPRIHKKSPRRRRCSATKHDEDGFSPVFLLAKIQTGVLSPRDPT